MKGWTRDLLQAARAVCVLVGTLIGAGYATGREVSQYFGQADTATVVLAAVLIAVMCMLFMYVGRRVQNPDGRLYRAYRWVMSVAALASCGAMLSAAHSLLPGAWTVVLVGAAGTCLAYNEKGFHAINMLAVPVLIGLVLWVSAGAEKVCVPGAFVPLTAANYAGMNLLLEVELLRREGESMTKRAILLSGVGIAGVMCLLLLAMHRMVGNSASVLPFAEVCRSRGMGMVVQLVIVTAVLTNVAGCMRLTLDTWCGPLPRALGAAAALVVAMLVATVPFANLVRTVYPVLGWLGVLVVLGYVVWALRLSGRIPWRFGRKGGRTTDKMPTG